MIGAGRVDLALCDERFARRKLLMKDILFCKMRERMGVRMSF